MVAAQEQTLPSSQTITRVELDNGVVVLAYEKPDVQSVVMTASVQAGSVYTTAAQAGLAAMAAEALMRGTTNRDFDALHTELEVMGADLDTGAARFKGSFSGKALAEDLPHLLEIAADVVRNPAFPEAQVERLRGEILTSINYSQQDTRYRARRAFYEALYPEGHPYHQSQSGTMETVPALTLDDLRAFHAKQYGPQGLVIVVVGKVTANAAVEAVRAQFADWTNPGQPPAAEAPLAPVIADMRRVFTPVPGKTQSDVVMGFVGPARSAEDFNAARLANAILGQFGMMGRIGSVVREEKGYAYYSRSGIEGGYGPGAWAASAGVNTDNVEETITDISHEFERIADEPVSDQELSDVQAYFTGSLPLQLESNEGIASTILRMETFGLGLDYLLTYRDQINALTKADLQQAAAHYIDTARVTISVAGPGTG